MIRTIRQLSERVRLKRAFWFRVMGGTTLAYIDILNYVIFIWLAIAKTKNDTRNFNRKKTFIGIILYTQSLQQT